MRTICPTVAEIEQAKSDMMRECEPFVKELVKLHERMPLAYILHKDGRWEPTRQLWPESAKQQAKILEDFIVSIKQKYEKQFPNFGFGL